MFWKVYTRLLPLSINYKNILLFFFNGKILNAISLEMHDRMSVMMFFLFFRCRGNSPFFPGVLDISPIVYYYAYMYRYRYHSTRGLRLTAHQFLAKSPLALRARLTLHAAGFLHVLPLLGLASKFKES